MQWEIWIDTGGTFTDCLGIDPEGCVHRCKVLSSGVLKAAVIDVGKDWVSIDRSHIANQTLFIGYSCEGKRIVDIDITSGKLLFDGNLNVVKGQSITITAHEPAPVLGARILTQTQIDLPLPVELMKLGTTRGTNALLERKGSKVALITNKGFKDILSIGYQQRPDLFSLAVEKRQMLYDSVHAIDARVAADGKVIQPLTTEALDLLIEKVCASQPETIAISLIHGVKYPQMEVAIAKRFEALSIPVTCGAHLPGEPKLIPRTETACVNAYLEKNFDEYLSGIQQAMPEGKLQIMTSAGFLVNRDQFMPKDSLLSGPAGGIVGAGKVANHCGFEKVLTLDMGGTSTDVARYENGPNFRYLTKVGDAEISAPCVSIETVAAGGGSICWFDGFNLRVGPESAGAHPGPACYGAGGPLTITDVNLLSGRTNGDQFSIPIDLAAAESELQLILDELNRAGFPSERQVIIEGFLQIANEKMAEAVRKISVSEGYHPPEFGLLAFGGAGAQHACDVADLLNIDTVIIPDDGSLLSAVGIGCCAIENIQRRAVSLDPVLDQTSCHSILQELATASKSQLRAQGIPESEIITIAQKVFMRYNGQEAGFDISANEPDWLETLQKAYQATFGYLPAERQVEVYLLEVHLGESSKSLPSVSEKPQETVNKTGGVYWSHVMNQSIQGPTNILHPYTTVYVPAGWTFRKLNNQGIITRHEKTSTMVDVQNSAVNAELFANRLTSIAQEMGAMLQRTAFSVNVKERLDYSCAVMDKDGQLVVNAPHIPVHLGSMGLCVRRVHAHLNLQPGQIAMTNHPAFGGSHLPDVTLVAGVFEKDELIGFVANRAHHAEIGGKTPGSMPADAQSLEEEGVVISPVIIAEGQDVYWELIESIFSSGAYPSRSIHENLADIKGAIASILSGVSGLQNLVANHGKTEVCSQMEAIQVHAHKGIQTIIESLPANETEVIEHLDDGSLIQLKRTIRDGKMTFDFTGTSPVKNNNLNANLAIVQSALIYFLRLMVDQDIPLNDGLLRSINLVLPHCFINPDFKVDGTGNPAVVGGNVEISQRLVDTLLKTTGTVACSQGTMNNFLFGNEDFGYYETICGGTGAGDGFDGTDAVHQHMTNTRITDPEILENRYPVRLLEFSVRKHSGGNGRFKGGNGVVRDFEFLAPMTITWLTSHRTVAPYGINAGNGRCGQQKARIKGQWRDLPATGNLQVKPQDRFIIETPGGGGYGD